MAAAGEAARVRLLAVESRVALPQLLVEAQAAQSVAAAGKGGGLFDLVYVDGSHLRADVLSDGVMAWHLLKARRGRAQGQRLRGAGAGGDGRGAESHGAAFLGLLQHFPLRWEA